MKHSQPKESDHATPPRTCGTRRSRRPPRGQDGSRGQGRLAGALARGEDRRRRGRCDPRSRPATHLTAHPQAVRREGAAFPLRPLRTAGSLQEASGGKTLPAGFGAVNAVPRRFGSHTAIRSCAGAAGLVGRRGWLGVAVGCCHAESLWGGRRPPCKPVRPSVAVRVRSRVALAMQKVEGSSPFIRFQNPRKSGLFLSRLAAGQPRRGTTRGSSLRARPPARHAAASSVRSPATSTMPMPDPDAPLDKRSVGILTARCRYRSEVGSSSRPRKSSAEPPRAPAAGSRQGRRRPQSRTTGSASTRRARRCCRSRSRARSSRR